MSILDVSSQLPSNINLEEYTETAKITNFKPVKVPAVFNTNPEITSQILEGLKNTFLSQGELYPVGIQGKSDVTTEENVGSKRITLHSKRLALVLQPLINHLKPVVLDDYSPMDWQSDNPEGYNYWVPLHISPLFRYMEYEEGGLHYAHYDAEYKNPEDPLTRTLYSGVLYLTDNEVYTRFIDDGQDSLPLMARNLEDHTTPTDLSSVYYFSKSEANSCIMFPHRICHDVSENKENKKRIIIRFDIFFKAIGKI